mmetsp:Transcript_52486/g.152805  ORF Transcript_52486/g.152805 Transcript_52486/m.152805 type:complete len:266 (+) Transcript_52486:612-1409(+)
MQPSNIFRKWSTHSPQPKKFSTKPRTLCKAPAGDVELLDDAVEFSGASTSNEAISATAKVATWNKVHKPQVYVVQARQYSAGWLPASGGKPPIPCCASASSHCRQLKPPPLRRAACARSANAWMSVRTPRAGMTSAMKSSHAQSSASGSPTNTSEFSSLEFLVAWRNAPCRSETASASWASTSDRAGVRSALSVSVMCGASAPSRAPVPACEAPACCSTIVEFLTRCTDGKVWFKSHAGKRAKELYSLRSRSPPRAVSESLTPGR